MSEPTTVSLEGLQFFAANDDEQERSGHRCGLHAKLRLIRPDAPLSIVLEATFRLQELPKTPVPGMERWLLKLLHRSLGEAVAALPSDDR